MGTEGMNDLISRSTLVKVLNQTKNVLDIPNATIRRLMLDWMIDIVSVAPAVDAEPVRRGEWTEPYKNDIWDCYVCSSCGYAQDRTSRYCPECGARMDGEG